MVTLDEKNMDPRETSLGPTSSWLPNSNADSDKHSVVLLAYAYDVAMAQMVLRVKSSQDFFSTATSRLGTRLVTRNHSAIMATSCLQI